MSNRNMARRTVAEIAFDGVDITRSIRPYLLSVSYTDNEEDETDDLQIALQDRGRIWTEQWLMEAIEAAAAEKLSIEAVLLRENQHSNGKDVLLPFGTFELDTVEASGPPNKITIKATSLPFHAAIRQTKKSKAWEGYTLSGIANEMAANSGMICMYESSVNPYYARVEQIRTSDIALLCRLCHEAGISLKATNKILVLFDQAEYEAKNEILTIRRGDGSYTRYQIGTGTADTQYASCRVRYENPAKGQCITGIATDDKVKNGQQLEVAARVASPGRRKCWRKRCCVCTTSSPRPPVSRWSAIPRWWQASRCGFGGSAAGTANISSARRYIRWTGQAIRPESGCGAYWRDTDG